MKTKELMLEEYLQEVRKIAQDYFDKMEDVSIFSFSYGKKINRIESEFIMAAKLLQLKYDYLNFLLQEL